MKTKDQYGCSAVTDFRTDGGLVLLTRCMRKTGHDGKHNDLSTKRWDDSQTTWHISPPAGPRQDAEDELLPCFYCGAGADEPCYDHCRAECCS